MLKRLGAVCLAAVLLLAAVEPEPHAHSANTIVSAMISARNLFIVFPP